MKAYKVIAGYTTDGAGYRYDNEEYYFNKEQAKKRYEEGIRHYCRVEFQFPTDFRVDITNVYPYNLENYIQEMKQKGYKFIKAEPWVDYTFSFDEIEIN